MDKKGSKAGMTGSTTTAKKGADMPPGMYAGMSTTPMGGGSEKPRRGYAEPSGVQYNGNCK